MKPISVLVHERGVVHETILLGTVSDQLLGVKEVLLGASILIRRTVEHASVTTMRFPHEILQGHCPVVIELGEGVDVGWVFVLGPKVHGEGGSKPLSLWIDGVLSERAVAGQRTEMLVVNLLQANEPGHGLHVRVHLPSLEIGFEGKQRVKLILQKMVVLCR